MFKDPNELKAFIVWAKEAKLKRFKMDGVEFEFSDLALIDPQAMSSLPEVTDFEQKTLTDTEPVDPKEENDLLFWSSR